MKYLFSGTTRLGILGGGQLGKMLLQVAASWDIDTMVLDQSSSAPAHTVSNAFFKGSLTDPEAVLRFGRLVDILTIEIENVSTNALQALADEGIRVFPQPTILACIQDKGLQKEFYRSNGFPTARFQLVDTPEEIRNIPAPFVQKLRTSGYDGKGVQVVRKETDKAKILNGKSVIEDCISIEKELAVIVARNPSGEIKTFPVVEMVFHPEANLVTELFMPADIPPTIEK
ncbi:MAG: ATP-grasp domain-containing protein, partial [Bacteroidia bacterium]|nr:ATP-grasp domain-containing protein [Bacteroidia bacterium]